jgi:proteasome beta subunit
MKRDSASGNGIDVVVITADKFNRLEEEEVQQYRDKLN